MVWKRRVEFKLLHNFVNSSWFSHQRLPWQQIVGASLNGHPATIVDLDCNIDSFGFSTELLIFADRLAPLLGYDICLLLFWYGYQNVILWHMQSTTDMGTHKLATVRALL